MLKYWPIVPFAIIYLLFKDAFNTLLLTVDVLLWETMQWIPEVDCPRQTAHHEAFAPLVHPALCSCTYMYTTRSQYWLRNNIDAAICLYWQDMLTVYTFIYRPMQKLNKILGGVVVLNLETHLHNCLYFCRCFFTISKIQLRCLVNSSWPCTIGLRLILIGKPLSFFFLIQIFPMLTSPIMSRMP